MRQDFARTVEECAPGQALGTVRRLSHIVVPSAFCALIFRAAHCLHAKRHRRAAAVLTLLNRLLCGVTIHPASVIGPGFFVPHTVGVTFCGMAGAGLTIYPMGYVAPDLFPGWFAVPDADWPVLGEQVRIGTYAAIIGAVAIGDRATIGVQVVIRKDLAAGLSAHVRPNWRTRSKAHTPASELA